MSTDISFRVIVHLLFFIHENSTLTGWPVRCRIDNLVLLDSLGGVGGEAANYTRIYGYSLL